jgi:hypothetical protein
LILLLACLATQIALGEPSLAEKNAAENAAINKEWESWNAPFPPFRLIGNIHFVGASGIRECFWTAALSPPLLTSCD